MSTENGSNYEKIRKQKNEEREKMSSTEFQEETKRIIGREGVARQRELREKLRAVFAKRKVYIDTLTPKQIAETIQEENHKEILLEWTKLYKENEEYCLKEGIDFIINPSSSLLVEAAKLLEK